MEQVGRTSNFHILASILVFCIIFNSLNYIKCDVERGFAESIVRTIELLDTEKYLLNATSSQMEKLKTKVNMKAFQGFISEIVEKHKQAENDAEAYLSNPLNSYSLIRRTYADWPKLLEVFGGAAYKNSILLSLPWRRLYLPTRQDMLEANEGLQRLQFYYRMNPTYLAEGVLFDKNDNVTLTCLDHYEIGQYFIKKSKPTEAGLWFKAALQKCLKRNKLEILIDQEIRMFRLFQLYLVYANVLIEQIKCGVKAAFESANEIITAATQKFPFEKQIWHMKNKISSMLNTKKRNCIESRTSNKVLENFVRCCQNKFVTKLKKFYCHFETKAHEFFKIAPLKMELLSLDPYIVLYHDAITAEEISDLKNKTEADMLEHDELDAWLPFEQTAKLFRRLAAMSGLNIEGFEELNVANYGIGSNAELHFDFAHGNSFKRLSSEEIRKASALLYLSDVEAGGETIFPLAKLKIKPHKGSILFWHNLDKDEYPAWKSWHGSCPIIYGSKWIATLWIRNLQQTFHTPCEED